MISCCSCFGTKTTSKDEGITIGDKEDPIILQPKVSVKVSIILSSYFILWHGFWVLPLSLYVTLCICTIKI